MDHRMIRIEQITPVRPVSPADYTKPSTSQSKPENRHWLTKETFAEMVERFRERFHEQKP